MQFNPNYRTLTQRVENKIDRTLRKSPIGSTYSKIQDPEFLAWTLLFGATFCIGGPYAIGAEVYHRSKDEFKSSYQTVRRHARYISSRTRLKSYLSGGK